MDPVEDDIRTPYSLATGLSEDNIFPISCLTKEGITKFGSGMAKILENMTGSRENVLATNERQRRLLTECISHLQAFLGALQLEKELTQQMRPLTILSSELKN
jgi:tRNA U34 5-carboxymethylaminomethyl modifying GTPase MnmE/TrmE